MIVVPLFNDDDESLELFIQMNGPTIKRHTISSTLTKGDAYIALCKNKKENVDAILKIVGFTVVFTN